MSDHITPPKSERKPLRQFVPKIVLLSTLYWLPIAIFVAIAREIRTQTPLPGDIPILRFVHSFSSHALNVIAVIITNFGGAPFVITAVTATVIALYVQRRRRQALFLAIAVGGTSILNFLLKLNFHRQRPALWQHIVTENDFSFPSGHAMITSAIALSAILLLWNTKYRWTAIGAGVVYVILVGLSRLYLGVHYPSDIVGGWMISILWVLTIHYAFGRFGRKTAVQAEK